MTSIELCDEAGRKVRVNVSGHWPRITSAACSDIISALVAHGDWTLSDYETDEVDAEYA